MVEKRWKKPVSMASGPWALDTSCHEVPALPIGSCHAGAGTGAQAYLLGPHPHWQPFRTADVTMFSAPSRNTALTPFWGAFWGHWWICS
jgi:hypothetical protein